MSIKSIIRLSEDVINRIAAGEVIQRPANAVKEMLENCLDAGSTNVSIILQEGGLKYLQIQDNGSGIPKEDMDIVCERFTTSKLKKFEDLTNISTYGFRGEALASISHVAHITIVSKTSDSLCAFKGTYSDGKLKESLKPCAGNVGTQIIVEDLFYNVPTRRLILKNATEEYQKIVDVVTRYAIHNPNVGFLVKKQNETNPDLKTQSGSSRLDNIALLFGSSIAKEILSFEHEDKKLSFKLAGCATNANYSSKKRAFILFINHRSVESTDLRKAVESVYNAYLPKGSYPFVYISLEISPQNIDVNVHPTKSEVHFMYESEIFDCVQRQLDSCLLGSNTSRTFYTQTMLPLKIIEEKPKNTSSSSSSTIADNARKNQRSSIGNSLNTSAHLTIRTDHKARKIDSFLVGKFNKGQILNGNADDDDGGGDNDGKDGGGGGDDDDVGDRRIVSAMEIDVTELSPSNSINNNNNKSNNNNNNNAAKKRNIKLTSILQLRKEIESNIHSGIREIIRNSTFVGCVDLEWCLIQHQTKLYLMNINKMSKEFFYQILIEDFGNFGVIKLSQPASIYELSILGLDDERNGWSRKDGSKDNLSKFVVELLSSKSAMLWDYLSIKIDVENGDLLSLPLIMDNLTPDLDDLHTFVLRLATEVNWDKEKPCFKTLCREISSFYVFKNEIKSSNNDNNNKVDSNENTRSINSNSKNPEVIENGSSDDARVEEKKWTIEHVIYPALKSFFLPPKSSADDGSLLQVANLPDLYKVFERC
ncbi:hypothetical protein HELRODRAFT_190644 [Helobdella robusta]|uniref:DNA mismatch repair protein S5 domain-containing protein n=1 Tax=Helobdella robusta TaxID=6412 RepID=T1FS59_HELRO|nr:hypothetical protein HELRODRAFT_190644 [Helobdella robusta]ESO08857.1 hypothetical protein HELRODRAFT_190644 [Helobdella robusta]